MALIIQINYKLLKANVKTYNDIQAFNVGIGSRVSVISFNNGHYSNSGVVSMDIYGINKNIVIALDDLLDSDSQKEPITFIKLDVEGHELSALEGMKNRPDRETLLSETSFKKILTILIFPFLPFSNLKILKHIFLIFLLEDVPVDRDGRIRLFFILFFHFSIC